MKLNIIVSCEICGKSFGSESGLRSHKLNTHSDTIFTCEICGKESKSKILFNNHMKTHLEKNCDQCDFKTNTKFGLRNHRIVHGDKPYFTCDKCDFVYTQKANFDIHVQKKHKI